MPAPGGPAADGEFDPGERGEVLRIARKVSGMITFASAPANIGAIWSGR